MDTQRFSTPFLDDPTVSGHERISVYKNSLILEYPCPQTTICSPYVLKLKPGRYQFEVWGAQGGGINTGISGTYNGGKGGYSKGRFLLQNTTTFYVYVGSSGINEGNGGYNGGGALGASSWIHAPDSNNRAPGGGATDIRLVKGSLETLKSIDFLTTYYGPNESLLSRVIVAGGGGGNDISGNGYGGGLQGGKFSGSSTSGNQTHPGKTDSGIDAGFGYGGFTQGSDLGISGGGGGWYGGGGSTYAKGGSGHVNKSFFYLSDTIPGNEPFPSPFGQSETGHSGDGVAKITYLNIFYDCTKRKYQPQHFLLSFFIFICK